MLGLDKFYKMFARLDSAHQKPRDVLAEDVADALRNSYFYNLVKDWDEVTCEFIGSIVVPGFQFRITSGRRYIDPMLTVLKVDGKWKVSDQGGHPVMESENKEETGTFILKWILSVL